MSASGYGHPDVGNGDSGLVMPTKWEVGLFSLLSMAGPRLSPTGLQSELT